MCECEKLKKGIIYERGRWRRRWEEEEEDGGGGGVVGVNRKTAR